MHARLLVFVSISLLYSQERQPGDANAWVNQGISAFKASHYADAVQAFQHAVQLEPAAASTRILLANAYLAQWVPGSNDPRNLTFPQSAQDELERVLQIDPGNKQALTGLGSLARHQALAGPAGERDIKLDEAAQWQQRLLRVDPGNAEALYSLGVIAWSKALPEIQRARALAGMRPQDPGPIGNANVRTDVQNRYGPTIEDGIANLERALQIDPHNPDAMAYLNLLYRERADLQATPADYQQDVTVADQWVQRALTEKRSSARPQRWYASEQLDMSRLLTPPPPPPVAMLTTGEQRIRVSGNVQAFNLIRLVDPVYPPLAMQARIQGTVRFSATIGPDGHVETLQLVSGHPLLVQAAQDAVMQYLYKPTLLNGSPVAVLTPIDVNFVLNK